MEIKNNIIKIIKEGITNSLKHGNSTEINIDLSFINSDIELIIQDNGNGCCEINSSNGLNGIKKRTETLNGEVTFQSSNKKGFTINLKIPGGVSND
ncbi:sensor histidine kinase [Clostridium felsineum]|nr:ATP-binding protein [Clostridium felsineum]